MHSSYKAERVGSSPTARTNLLAGVNMFVDDKQYEKEAGRVFWAFVTSITAASGLILYLGYIA